jgi:hypothetical protein
MKDHDGHSLAYVYFEEEPGRRAATRLMTRDEPFDVKSSDSTQCVAILVPAIGIPPSH